MKYVVLRPNSKQEGACAYPFHAFLCDEGDLADRVGKDIFEGDLVFTVNEERRVMKIEPPLKLVSVSEAVVESLLPKV
jgi:hypothetical protein